MGATELPMSPRIDSLGTGDKQVQQQRTRPSSELMDASSVGAAISRMLARIGARVSALRSGPPHATGMAILDASSDFERARRAYLAGRLVRWLTPGRPGRSHPRALNGVTAFSWRAPRLRVIPIRAVVGTVDPTHDFDASFRPATPTLAARWQRVALAYRQGRPLAPISVIERPDGYYVIDGRHRVSVARALRYRDIEAWVSPIVAPHFPAPPDPALYEKDTPINERETTHRAAS
jgi:hypothetical protein